LVKWDKPQLFGETLKPDSVKNALSEYSTVRAKQTFEDLISNLNCKYIVVSYSNTSKTNKMTLDEITDILNKKGETKIYDKTYKPFSTGQTNYNDHKEFLFITKL
jgi:adenine-specific DNA-methyltransferase